jgi:hypothetical protein
MLLKKRENKRFRYKAFEDNTTQVEADTDNRHIISTKSQGFFQTPQDIMEEYNGCSVPQYTRYPLVSRDLNGFKYGHLCVYAMSKRTVLNNTGARS